KWQRWAIVHFYLRNFRLLDLMVVFVKYRRGIFFMLRKLIAPENRGKGNQRMQSGKINGGDTT
ncbi:hypothetical protein ACFLWS_08705, partial [Chloroflexota bacterium]